MGLHLLGVHGNIRLAWLAVLGALLLGLSPAHGGIISEDFHNNTYNQNNFHISTQGTGPSTAVTNNRLEITVPGNSYGANGFGASIVTNFNLFGDFDAQVDYTLLTWPSPAGFMVGLQTELPGNYTLFRQSYAPGGTGEVYEAYLGGPDQKIATADSSGKLRLKRTGNTIAAFYWHNNTWTPISSNTGAGIAGATGIFIFAFGNQFQGKTVQVAFDNIRIAYGSYAPGLLQLLLDN
ncbi:MAG: hypothetical protein NTY36_17965 [Deltaproteobacteria bacterium]|nr:hypothetical protein [Deltaproteobacteria bacterium]